MTLSLSHPIALLFSSFAPRPAPFRLKHRYEDLGSLQALADEMNMHTGRLGRVLVMHDRRTGGSDADYAGPERRRKG